MRRIGHQTVEPLHSSQDTRAIETEAAATLPAHTLMARAGLAVARLTQALAPHAQTIWVACGPGNNGGDGLIAAAHLFMDAQTRGIPRSMCVTLAAHADKLPTDAAHALQWALAAGVTLAPEPPSSFDFGIDALLGIGLTRAPQGAVDEHLQRINQSGNPVLCVDVPSGLMADTGHLLRTGLTSSVPSAPRYTLSLLTLKPGLFTAHGRDAAGEIWFDDLGQKTTTGIAPTAFLSGFSAHALSLPPRHASHKGSNGEVLVIGGQAPTATTTGMMGAAFLASRAALRMGAGRVYLALLGQSPSAPSWDPLQPEIMLRSAQAALQGDLLERSIVVCGCGGGQAIAALLAPVLSRAKTLVLDADALNAIAADTPLQTLLTHRQAKGWTTVITPHSLEAARLLASTTDHIMADRLAAAHALSEKFGVICVLKGSGTVIQAPRETPQINASGNGILATAGTGDVLAGMLGAALATQAGDSTAATRVAQAVFEHGRLADEWVKNNKGRALCADQLTQG